MKTRPLRKTVSAGKWLALVWFAGFLIAAAIIRYEREQAFAHYLQKQQSVQQVAWAAALSLQETGTKAYAEAYVMQPEVLALLERAQNPKWADHARKELYKRLLPAYAKLSAESVHQFHFHTPDSRSFLRFHAPDRYGDSLIKVRSSVVAANRTLESVHGFELGRVTPGFRNVFPIIHNGKHLGSVELSQPFEAVRREMARLSPLGVHALILNTQSLLSALFEQYRPVYKPSPFHKKWVLEEATDGTVCCAAPAFNGAERSLAEAIGADERIKAAIENQTSAAFALKHEGRYYIASLLLIEDIEAKPAAYLISTAAAGELDAADKNFWINLGATVGLMGLLAGALFWLHRMREQEWRAREELEFLIAHDPLTGLGNRIGLLRDIEAREMSAVALIDIDRFNEINDFYGHAIGDRLLIEFADRLNSGAAAIGPQCRLYRYHGDQFALLGHGVHDIFLRSIQTLCTQLVQDVFEAEGKEITLRITVAVSFEPAQTLMSTVEMAIRHAKKQKQNFILYDVSLGLEKYYEENIKWAQQIAKALEEGRIIPFYQPIRNNRTGAIEKYEALARMRLADGTIISPAVFIEIAKRSRQYAALTRVIFTHAAEAALQSGMQISINLTVEDIRNEALAAYMFERLGQMPHGRMVFELVESEGIENFDEVTHFIERVHQYGCKVAIDDFGTGYSNFSYLGRLRADYIKIDGSLISNLDKDATAWAVVETIVDFAGQNGFEVIAEFVSNEAIEKAVNTLGIHYSQGYRIGKPEPVISGFGRDVTP